MLVSKQPAGLVWQRGPSCFGNRRLLHAPRVWAGAFRPRVCGGPAGATRTFLGDRPFRAISEWLLVGSHHSVVSSRARAGVGLGFGGREGAGGGSRIEPRGHNQQRNVNSGRQRMRTAHMGGCGSRSTCNKTSPIKSPASQQNAMLCTKSLGFNKTSF